MERLKRQNEALLNSLIKLFKTHSQNEFIALFFDCVVEDDQYVYPIRSLLSKLSYIEDSILFTQLMNNVYLRLTSNHINDEGKTNLYIEIIHDYLSNTHLFSDTENAKHAKKIFKELYSSFFSDPIDSIEITHLIKLYREHKNEFLLYLKAISNLFFNFYSEVPNDKRIEAFHIDFTSDWFLSQCSHFFNKKFKPTSPPSFSSLVEPRFLLASYSFEKSLYKEIPCSDFAEHFSSYLFFGQFSSYLFFEETISYTSSNSNSNPNTAASEYFLFLRDLEQKIEKLLNGRHHDYLLNDSMLEEIEDLKKRAKKSLKPLFRGFSKESELKNHLHFLVDNLQDYAYLKKETDNLSDQIVLFFSFLLPLRLRTSNSLYEIYDFLCESDSNRKLFDFIYNLFLEKFAFIDPKTQNNDTVPIIDCEQYYVMDEFHIENPEITKRKNLLKKLQLTKEEIRFLIKELTAHYNTLKKDFVLLYKSLSRYQNFEIFE